MFGLTTLYKNILHCNYNAVLTTKFINQNTPIARLINSVTSHYTSDRDPAHLFFNRDVQKLLKTLTRVDLNKVFVKRKVGDTSLSQPVYKFMTDEELQASIVEANKHADALLQMPPVVLVRKPIDKILIQDPALQGSLTHKMVFTDITYGVKDEQRLIVVRDSNGTLQEADRDVRDRMNQIYFPRHGRKLKVPRMFYGEYLEDVLRRFEYKFLLDRACIQFEPDNPEYHRITDIAYRHLNEHNKFDKLRSTRHFGPLAFYLTWFNNIDNLLLELIETAHIEEAVTLLKLYSKIHNTKFNLENELEGISQFITKFAHKKSSLELALQSFQDLRQERSNVTSVV